MRVYRLDPKTGKKQFPTKEAGSFVLGDLKNGSRKHVTANTVSVRTEQEMIDLIMRGSRCGWKQITDLPLSALISSLMARRFLDPKKAQIPTGI